MPRRNRLNLTALPLAAAVSLGVPAAWLAGTALVAPTAMAQVNPCAPMNPCAAARPRAPVNPCAAVNPCAPMNPCAAVNPRAAQNPCAAVNPCAARPAVAGDAANPFDVPAGYTQAPFGDAMPDIVKNYLRAAPYVGTGGVVDPTAFPKLKELGFHTVLNLNTDDEGAQAEGAAAQAAGLAYVHIPVSTRAPTDAEVDRFTSYVNDPQNYPILVHCQSSNRVGAMWALYRADNGVPAGIAVQEGRTVGLTPSRETAVRERLGLPPL